MPFKEDQYLKLYTERDRDVVWLADGLGTPFCTQLSVHRFLRHYGGRGAALRVLGLPQNARLLAGLCELCVPHDFRRLEIAGPLVCETDAERADPARTLFRMRQCLLSPSLGGWHVASPADTAIYRLAARLQEGPPGEDSDQLVLAHPVWRDISFIGRADLRACGEVLAHLIDPRWYVDPMHPERTARAEAYMGIIPKIVGRLRDSRPTHPRYSRFISVLKAWKCDPPPSRVDTERPEYFLWRRRREQAEEWRGDLRASSAFLQFVLRTWLQRLVDFTPRPVNLFSPSAIFKPFEATAYRAHVAQHAG